MKTKLVGLFEKLLIWDFHTRQSLEITQNSAGGTDPEEGLNALLFKGEMSGFLWAARRDICNSCN